MKKKLQTFSLVMAIASVCIGAIALAPVHASTGTPKMAEDFNKIANPALPQITQKQAVIANMMIEYGAIQAFFEHCNYAGYAQLFRDARALLPPEHLHYYNMGYNDNQGNNDVNCKSGDALWLEVEPLIKRTIKVLKNNKKAL